jgi:hypothetical protein
MNTKLTKSGVVLGMENKHFVRYEDSAAESIESEGL